MQSSALYLIWLFVLAASANCIAQQNNSFPSWALGPFIRPANGNPVIIPDTTTKFLDPMSGKKIAWEASDTFNPAAVVMNNKVYVLYRAEDNSAVGIGQRTSRLGLAFSNNGIDMHRRPVPVLYPANDKVKEFEWTGGCEDPRVAATPDGRYLVLYTEWNHKRPRLAAALSKDLIHWTKYGPIFAKAYGGKFANINTKSASIVTQMQNNKLFITKVKGKYWIYWGEEHVYAATSDDLVNWTPLTDPDGKLKIFMSPRQGYFDSDLTECGPPALLTKKGILLLYNGKNNATHGDKHYTSNTYSAGQVLFDAQQPDKILERLDKPFFTPTESFEKSGQYPAGTVFVEGLAYFKNQWMLYYGSADSRVGVAISKSSTGVE